MIRQDHKLITAFRRQNLVNDRETRTKFCVGDLTPWRTAQLGSAQSAPVGG
jgi:hypothetical protein